MSSRINQPPRVLDPALTGLVPEDKGKRFALNGRVKEPRDASKRNQSHDRSPPHNLIFLLAFAISWSAALAVASPRLLSGEPISKTSGILMFPAMLLGPILSGLLMTRLVDGSKGVRELFARVTRVRVRWTWYALVLLPPATVLTVLLALKTFLSAAFTPNRFFLGIAFGVPAGVLEEFGWTGFAFPRMQARFGTLKAGVLLGLLWSAWHLPVIDFLGAATPHGQYLIPFFFSFATAMTAVRILIGWAYTHTKSVFLGATDPHQFHGRPGNLQSASSYPAAGNFLVLRLWRSCLDHHCYRRARADASGAFRSLRSFRKSFRGVKMRLAAKPRPEPSKKGLGDG